MHLRGGARIALLGAALGLAGATPALAQEAPAPPTGDPAVAARVGAQLDREGFREKDVRVRVREGVVTLSGHVSSASEKEEAAGVARAVRGVSEVVNELAVGELDADQLPPTGSELPPASQ